MRLVVSALWLLIGCQVPTQVVVNISADEASAVRAESVRIRVFSSGEEIPRLNQEVDLIERESLLSDRPLTLTLVPDDRDASRRFRVVAELVQAADPFARLEAVASFVDGARADLHVRFADECEGSLVCPAQRTCAFRSSDDPSVPGGIDCVDSCVAPTTDPGVTRTPPTSCASNCEFAGDGLGCSVDGVSGRCWNQACCAGCFDGTTCLAEESVSVCGRFGAVCVACGSGESCTDGLCTNVNGPTTIAVSDRWAEIANTTCMGSGAHVCSGSYCWGRNDCGQVDPLSPSLQGLEPTLRPGGGENTRFATGGFHSCSYGISGVLRCWGNNTYGQLNPVEDEARNLTSADLSPTPTGPSTSIWEIPHLALGENHTCAVLEERVGDGADLYCWGRNDNGQLGLAAATRIPTRVALPDSDGLFSSLSAADKTTCAVRGGSLYCWGKSAEGTTFERTPTRLRSDLVWDTVDVARTGVCGITTDRKLYCAGSPNSDLLGMVNCEGTCRSLEGFSQISDLRFSQVDLGKAHLCGITFRDNRLVCIGQTSKGAFESTPNAVLPAPGSYIGNSGYLGSIGHGWFDVEAGDGISCGVTAGMVVFCWGNNRAFEFGAAMPGESPTPVRVPFPMSP